MSLSAPCWPRVYCLVPNLPLVPSPRTRQKEPLARYKYCHLKKQNQNTHIQWAPGGWRKEWWSPQGLGWEQALMLAAKDPALPPRLCLPACHLFWEPLLTFILWHHHTWPSPQSLV